MRVAVCGFRRSFPGAEGVGIMKTKHTLLASGALFIGMLLPSLAQAKLAACGGVFLTGDAKCEFVRDQDCQTHCETTSVETACVASLETSCESECTASAETSCTETCTPSCTEQCTTVEKQSSRGLCRSDCSQDCSAQCEGKDNKGRCESCCQQHCNVRCEDHCRDDDTEEVCDTKCTPVCEDSCVAKANNTCQIDCQTTNFESCQTTTTQTCQTDCHDDGGAIFCDGQFLNVTNLKDCVAELASQLSIKVDIDIDVAVTTNTDVNNNGKKDSVKCSIGPTGGDASGNVVLGLMVAGALAAATRRRRSQ
jgi:MYXO-CTERM domain-containing protein